MLHPPSTWIDELSRLVDPEAFTPPRSGDLKVNLTYRAGLPDRLAEAGLTLKDVAADLAAGFALERRMGSDGYYYCMSSARFDVFVSPQTARDSGARIAVVTSVKPVTRLARWFAHTGALVGFYPSYDEMSCHIARLHHMVEQESRREQLRRRAHQQASHLLANAEAIVSDHSRLHARVRRHYSALLTLLELLQQRSETEGAATACGEVVDLSSVAGDLLCARIREQQGEFEDGAQVELTAPGVRQPLRLELVRAEDDIFYLEPPERQNLVPSTPISVTRKPRFGLGRHSYALNRFLDGKVEGDWGALAQLLVAPKSLHAFAAPPAVRFFADAEPGVRLNEEQRLAIAGAVAAAHVYFIQGPPGTGKTTVITEIVRQLISRGERVLLLAPMHVAVDEVLWRVGDKDGVLALRVAWDDSRVREDLRRFTPANVAAEFVRRARRPATSKAALWRTRITQLMAERDQIDHYVAARRHLDAAEVGFHRAARALESWQAGYQVDLRQAETDLDQTRDTAGLAQARLGACQEAERHAAEELAAARASRTFGDRLAGVFGAGTTARSARNHRAAAQQLAQAETAASHFSTVAMAAESRMQAIVQQGATERAYRERAVADTAEQVAAARWADRAQARALRPLVGDAAALQESDLLAGAEAREAEARRLETYIHLERRWFQLTGLGDAAEDAQDRLAAERSQELLQAANLVCCTTAGFGGDKLVRDADYDTLIVDEASRVIDSEFLIGAKQARRWILVGDEHQLPPYVEAADEYHLHALAALHMTERGAAPNLPAAVAHLGRLWQEQEDAELHQFRSMSVQETAEQLQQSGSWRGVYRPTFRAAYERLRQLGDDPERELLRAMHGHLVQSLFERCVTQCPPTHRQRLVVQRRMVEAIAAIVRDPVYGGDYRSPSEPELREAGITPLVTDTFGQPVIFLDTSSHASASEDYEGTGVVNRFEASWIAAACRMWESELRRRGESATSVSVLAFYRAQAREIRRLLGHPAYKGFRVVKFQVIDAIDRIQGQESDVVFLSFCRTRHGRPGPGFGRWLQDVRRLNVACTRARRALVLVGHRRTLERMSGVPAAEEFYRHFFQLLEERPDMVSLKEMR